MSMEDIRKKRNMPFLKRGMRVEFLYGRKGRISGAHGLNLSITFDGDKFSQNCHPQWMMRYLDKEKNIIKEYGDS